MPGKIDLSNPINWNNSLNRGLMGFWLSLTGRIGGTTIWDLAAAHRHGILGAGTPTWTRDKINLTTSTDRYDFGTSMWNGLTDAITLELVTNLTGAGGNLFYFGRGYDGSNAQFVFCNIGETGQNIGFGFYNGSWHLASDPSAIDITRVYHIVGTYDRVTIRLYLDGVQVAGTADTTAMPVGTNNVTLGAVPGWIGGQTQVFQMASIRSVALPADGVQKIYREYKTGFPTLLNRQRTLGKAPAAGTAYNRTLSESLGQAEAFARLSDGLRIYTESQGHTDTYSRLSDALRSFSDNQGHSDAYSRLSDASRVYSENQGHSDTFSRLSDALRAFTDTLGLADAYSRLSDALRAFTDTLGLTDAYVRVSDANRDFEDLLALTDVVDLDLISTGVLTLVVIESLGLVDTFSRISDGVRSISDNVGTADAYARIVDAMRLLTDSAGLADAFAQTTLWVRGLLDTLGTADAYGRLSDSLRAVADTQGHSDAYSRQSDYLRALVDNAGLTDAYTRLADAVRAYADTMGLADDVDASILVLVIVSAIIAFDVRFRAVVDQEVYYAHVQKKDAKLPHVQNQDVTFATR